MGVFKDFRDFAMKGNVVDLAVGVIIGAAFGKIVTSLVEDVIMPPIGMVLGNLDFTNLYFSLSEKVDAANAKLAAKAAATAAQKAATQPATQLTDSLSGAASAVGDLLSGASRLPLAEAKKLGPVIAYGNFITVAINFLIVAFCIFIVIKLINTARKRMEREQQVPEQAGVEPVPADVALLTEIRDLLKGPPSA